MPGYFEKKRKLIIAFDYDDNIDVDYIDCRVQTMSYNIKNIKISQRSGAFPSSTHTAFPTHTQTWGIRGVLCAQRRGVESCFLRLH